MDRPAIRGGLIADFGYDDRKPVYPLFTAALSSYLKRVLLSASMKTKGALLWELNSPFKIDEIDLGDPVADEVQIQMHASGMCHSDYHITTGATPIGLPALGGHEGAGVVTKIGKNVTGIAEGDHVILAFIPACGECPPC